MAADHAVTTDGSWVADGLLCWGSWRHGQLGFLSRQCPCCYACITVQPELYDSGPTSLEIPRMSVWEMSAEVAVK